MRPALRLLGLLLLGLALYLYGASSQVAWLFLLAFWIWAFALAAFWYSRWNARGISARIAFRVSARAPQSPLGLLPEQLVRVGPLPEPVFEGDSVALRVEFRSASGSRGPARLEGSLAGSPVAAGAGLVSAAGTVVEEEGEPRGRGVLEIGSWRLLTSDPLGLFTQAARLDETSDLVVLPAFAELAQQPRQLEVEASLAAPRAGAGNELFGVREYRPGDPLRRIHWRSSARRGELVVREFEPPGLRTVELVLDPDPPTQEAADQAARIAASEVWDAWRAGGQVYLSAPGLRGTGGREARSFWALLEWLGRYPELPPEDSWRPHASELVAVASRPQGPALERLESARSRGSRVRAWTVGFQAELPFEVREAGLAWPLSE